MRYQVTKSFLYPGTWVVYDCHQHKSIVRGLTYEEAQYVAKQMEDGQYVGSR